jgi:hypothetical protein
MTSMSWSAASGASLPAGKASGVFSARAGTRREAGRQTERRREEVACPHLGAPAGITPPATLAMASSMGM